MNRLFLVLWITILSVGCSNDPVARCKDAKNRVAELEGKRVSAYEKMQNSFRADSRDSANNEFSHYGDMLVYAEQDRIKACSGR